MPHALASTHFAAYRLAEDVMPEDLYIAPYQRMDLSPQDPQSAKHIIQLSPKTIYDLKSWIGVPHGAVAQSRPPFNNIPTHFQPSRVTTPKVKEIQAKAYNFVFGHTNDISSHDTHEINKWLLDIELILNVVVLQDILISAWAQLVLTVDGLLAQHITVVQTGSIVIPPSTHTKITCASFRSVPRYLVTKDHLVTKAHSFQVVKP